MTSAGEKQHYALALLHRFFQHVDEAFTLGLLYDIGCQLERSCRKWGFLAAYLPRIRFGISVFHAFGHQWPCQLLYHPRKCVGFGLSDGEGCERFWSAIRPLIPSLRTSGWLKRRWNYCQEKKEHAESRLEELGWSMETLKAEWLAQVTEQTKPAPRSREIIQWEKALEANRSIMMDLTKAMANRNGNPTELTMQLNEATARDTKLKNDIRIGKARLGVDGQANLTALRTNAYLQARMNARALIQRLRDRLRQRKFELEKLERSYRQNNQRLVSFTVWSNSYQRHPFAVYVSPYPSLVQITNSEYTPNGACTRGATPPNPIARDGLFLLDVDDNIWQDIGLYDEDDSVHPPAWLADEKVREGIRFMLEYDRCVEEQLRLTKERCLLQEYMLEEWTRAETLCRETDDEDLIYYLQRRKDWLHDVYQDWRIKVLAIPSAWPMPASWGPSNLARSDDQEQGYSNDDYSNDSQTEQSENGSVDYLLDTAEDVALADEYRYANLHDLDLDDIDNELLEVLPLLSLVREPPKKR
ncbi:hypothetical protein BU15DRAFT_83984, partial [Melanogaster broomeanus]